MLELYRDFHTNMEHRTKTLQRGVAKICLPSFAVRCASLKLFALLYEPRIRCKQTTSLKIYEAI